MRAALATAGLAVAVALPTAPAQASHTEASHAEASHARTSAAPAKESPANAAPTSAAATKAGGPLHCAAFHALCTWTGRAGTGTRHFVFENAAYLHPAARSVRNRTNETWCLYELPRYKGTQKFELTPYAAKKDLGFTARSARVGSC